MFEGGGLLTRAAGRVSSGTADPHAVATEIKAFCVTLRCRAQSGILVDPELIGRHGQNGGALYTRVARRAETWRPAVDSAMVSSVQSTTGRERSGRRRKGITR
jgi:hypothetical protein